LDGKDVFGAEILIVRLTGGLCNQLFLYAFGRGVSLERNLPVQFYFGRSTWDYGLNPYVAKIKLVNRPQNMFTYEEPGFAFDERVYATPSNTYFIGYFQTERYFKKQENIIRQELTLKEIRPEVQELAKRLQDENSVFIHVRRGDYLNPGTAAYHGNLGHASLTEGYYKDAISYIKEKVDGSKFHVFSDDPGWCKQNLPFPVITGFAPHEDLYLMSQCRHSIGANSTFSWWGSWLGDYEGRVNVFPKKWFNAEADTRDIIPERWVRL
jgi:Glycosyl transferase family 11